MREEDRKLMRRKLDVEMRPYRRAAADKDPTEGLLRAVRLALRIPSTEIARTLGIRRSNVFYLEEREKKGTIGLLTLSRAADAMGCMMVYGIVPKGGKTMEALFEERMWADALGLSLNTREMEEAVRATMDPRAEGGQK